jgi:hypothetical protein
MILPFFEHIVYTEQSRPDRMVQCHWFAGLKYMNEAYKPFEYENKTCYNRYLMSTFKTNNKNHLM